MLYVLYGIWILLPVFFFGLALWTGLERISGKQPQEHPTDYFRQGLFVASCVAAAFAFDAYLLADLVHFLGFDDSWLWFFRLILLPIILFLGAKLLGGSHPVRISEVSPSSRHERRKR